MNVPKHWERKFKLMLVWFNRLKKVRWPWLLNFYLWVYLPMESAVSNTLVRRIDWVNFNMHERDFLPSHFGAKH